MGLTAQQLDEAASGMYRATALDMLTRPSAIEEWCRKNFDANGYKIKNKKGKLFYPGKRNVTTTMPGTLWLAATFELKEPEAQAEILAHERIHMAQQLHVGGVNFSLQYATLPKQRLIWELQAYAESARVAKRMGRDVRGYPQGCGELIWDTCEPWLGLSKATVINAALDVLGRVV